MQFDEKWAFVGKKEKHCDPDDPADAQQGDNWDHVAFDPEHRLVVHKTRGKGRVTKIDYRVIFGTVATVLAALALSLVSRAINTAFVERHNGTDRNRNGRKVRKTYCFSKDWQVHEAVTYFTMYSYNFCWPVRTLRVRGTTGAWEQRTPAMTAGLTDHVWSLAEWLTYPTLQRE